jgi:FMN phosphatase YigB (HAD superfamily)
MTIDKDATLQRQHHASHAPLFPEHIFASDISRLLEKNAPKIKMLSLDCFDTLLWRKTATPGDVFFTMQQLPTFKKYGITALMRSKAESDARRLKLVGSIKTEVTLKEIYQQILPHLSDAELSVLEEEELFAEKQACFAYPATVELIRAAKQRGLNIIVVSDTYFTEKQLHELLSHHLPQDALAAIDKIFCSVEYEKSKANGLFEDVLKFVDIHPEKILHLGDNKHADYSAPKLKNIAATHLIQHDEKIAELMRMHHSSASIMDSTIRHTRPLNDFFKSIFSSSSNSLSNPESLVGYAALGPLMYAFGKFICNEYYLLKNTNKNPKMLFLMRDAYLPSLVCEKIEGQPIGHRVSISRFASYAASFQTKNDVMKYLAEFVTSSRLVDIGKQLLLPENVVQNLIKKSDAAQTPWYEFSQLILDDKIIQQILNASKKYKQRLITYIKTKVELQKDDTLILVDLGYSGTTQRLLAPILENEFQINVIGRYLISLPVPQWNYNRRGLLDPGNCDEKSLMTLVKYVALLEQLSTCNEKSVIDYDNHGNPIFSNNPLKKGQFNKLTEIQAECLRLADDANQFLKLTQLNLSDQDLKDIALFGITRLIFFPVETEVKHLDSFEFDLNLGTNDKFKLYDFKEGLNGLINRGLFSIFTDRNKKSFRTNISAEFRAAGIELAIALVAQHRFCLEFSSSDVSFRKEKLTLILRNDQETTQVEVDATYTYDGYFAAHIPLGNNQYDVGVLFGAKNEWVQIESANLIHSGAFSTESESEFTIDASQNLMSHDMESHGNGLFKCTSLAGMLLFPRLDNTKNSFLLRFVFRPIVPRAQQSNDANANR